MKYPIEKDFIIKSHATACTEWKRKIEDAAPEAFDESLKGYTGFLYCKESLIMTGSGREEATKGKIYWGVDRNGRYTFTNNSGDNDHEVDIRNTWFRKATEEEIEKLIVVEATERGFEENMYIDRVGFPSDLTRFDKIYPEHGTHWNKQSNSFTFSGRVIFKDGIWAKPVNIEYLKLNIK